MSYTAGEIMNMAAALLNDAPRSLYTYVAQIPMLKLACQMLEDECDAHEHQINLISEYETIVTAGSRNPSLPENFFVPITLQERQSGSTSDADYVPITEVPNVDDLRRVGTTSLNEWDYRHNCINFVPATTDREVRIYYWRSLTPLVDETTNLVIKRGQTYLEFKTAALCARFIGSANINKADALDVHAQSALDTFLTLIVKNNQGKRRRRLPFRTRRAVGYRVSVP